MGRYSDENVCCEGRATPDTRTWRACNRSTLLGRGTHPAAGRDFLPSSCEEIPCVAAMAPRSVHDGWVPAFAGMTKNGGSYPDRASEKIHLHSRWRCVLVTFMGFTA